MTAPIPDDTLAELERLAKAANVFWCDARADGTGLHAGTEVDAATILAMIARVREAEARVAELEEELHEWEQGARSRAASATSPAAPPRSRPR